MEEFIAVVFGTEVWMGLVDFKSDKPPEEIDEEIGIPSLNSFIGFGAEAHCSERYEEKFSYPRAENVSNSSRTVHATSIDPANLRRRHRI